MLSIFSTLDSMKTNMNWFLLIMEVILEITSFRAKLMFLIVAINIVSETYEYWNSELRCKRYIWYYNVLPGVHLPTKQRKVFQMLAQPVWSKMINVSKMNRLCFNNACHPVVISYCLVTPTCQVLPSNLI